MTSVPESPLASAIRRAKDTIAAIRHGDGIGVRLARGSAAALVVQVLGALIALGLQVLLTRGLGATQYGTYLVALGWMNWASLVARFQYDLVATRYMSEYRATQQLGLLRSFVRYSHRLVTLLSVGVGVVAIAVVLFTDWVPGDRRMIAIAAAALLLPNTLLPLTAASIEAFQRVAASQSAMLVVRPALLAIAVMAVLLIDRELLTTVNVLWFNAAGSVAALGFALWYLRGCVRAEGSAASVASPPAKKQWTHTAVGFWWVTVAQQALTPQTDILVVGALLSAEQAGFYGIASAVATLVGFGVNAVSAMGAPMIAQLYAQGRKAELERLIKHYGRLNALVTLPVFAGLVLFGSLVLRVFGKDFAAGYPVLLVLGVTHVIRSAVGSQAGYLLTMTGRERLAGRYVGYSALINVVATLILTPLLGILGTALATLIATLARSVILISYVRREFGIDVTGFLRINRP